MICYLFPTPTYLFFSTEVPKLLYYSHIPTTIIALLVGFYLFWHGRNFLLNRLLFAITILFSIWTVINLITWTNTNSNIILFSWSFIGMIFSLISICCIYFTYVFLEKKDISLKLKTVFLVLISPVFLLTPTYLNLSGFDITNCDAFKFEQLPFEAYYTFLGALAMVWIFVLLIRRYKKADSNFKKQIILMGAGIEFFLFFFFFIIFLASYLTKIGLLPDSNLELYGLFGMVIFMVYISILIVRFGAFNAKLIATQALVWGLGILIGSQFFFIKVSVNFVLNGVTFVGVIIVGYFLIKSVKKEIEQKEQLKVLLQQRESLTHLVTHKVKGSFTRSKYIFAEILEGTFGAVSPELKEMAKKGLDSDNQGISTVDLVLNAANLQTGTVKYDMKQIDFKELVKKVSEEMKEAIDSKGLKYDLQIEDGVYNILGDEFWMKEVVHNLIDNALKYTLKGEINVRLARKENKIIFSVKDTGVGITEEDKKNLFKEGGRGKNSVKVNVDSTGYGLYTVKLIVDAHKGKIQAESEGENKGTKFSVELEAI